MKFGVVNKSTTVNRFVLHTLQRNITHLAVITRKTNIKLDILKGGKLEKSQKILQKRDYHFLQKSEQSWANKVGPSVSFRNFAATNIETRGGFRGWGVPFLYYFEIFIFGRQSAKIYYG